MTPEAEETRFHQGRCRGGRGGRHAGDETLDIGRDGSTPVSGDYPMGSENAFKGKIYSVTVDIGKNPTACYEPPENILARLMAGQ